MKPVTSALRHAAVALGLALGLALLLALLLALTIPAALAHQAISGRLTPAHEGGPGTSAPFARAPALQSREHHGVSISGAVFNSTHGDAPVSGQTVTLQALMNNQPTTVASASTSGGGRFFFANVTPDPSASYLLTTQYQGGAFATSEITSAQLGAQPVTLHVFDTTTSDANMRVGLATLVVGEPKQRSGLIPIAESVTMLNTGRTAYVTSLTPSGDKPMSVLRFALPAGATNLVLGVGFATGQVTQVATGLGVGATLPPGKTEFAFAYNIPYAGGTYLLSHTTEYATRQIAALVPTDIAAEAGDFTPQPVIKAAGKPYQLFVGNDIAPLTTLSLSLRNLPAPGEPQYLDVRALALVAGLLVVLLLCLLGLSLRHGDLAFLLGLPSSSPVGRITPPEREKERWSLLREHLALDQARAAGEVNEADYQRRRNALRTQLRALLATGGLPLTGAAAGSSTVENSQGTGLSSTAKTPTPTTSSPPAAEGPSPRRRSPTSQAPRRGLIRQPAGVQEEARDE